MSSDKVKKAFVEAFDLPADADVESLEIGATPAWDSLGHMALVADLEDLFGIELETDDMIGITSYGKSLEVLRRYGVEV